MANELNANLSALELTGEILFLEETGHSLADKVLRKVQDGSYSWEDVVSEFNACLDYLAGKYLLIELEHTENIETDPLVNRVAMPANYMKNLWFCRSLTHNRPVKVHKTVINAFRQYAVLDQSGVVREVAVKGRYLYYQRVPTTAETLKLIYYRYPDRLRTRHDKPTCLPPHLVDPLLVNYACKEIFSEIEDPTDGPMVGTDKYSADFNKAEADLIEFLGPQRRAPVEFPDELTLDAYV